MAMRRSSLLLFTFALPGLLFTAYLRLPHAAQTEQVPGSPYVGPSEDQQKGIRTARSLAQRADTTAHADQQSQLRPPSFAPGQPGFCRTVPPPDVPNVQVYTVWESSKSRLPTDITLVTQLSIERLHMLEQQCSAWGSVISAAVHVPSVLEPGPSAAEARDAHSSTLTHTLQHLHHFHERMEKSRCALDLLLVTERLSTTGAAALYPVNALRNRALMYAETEIVLLLDVDFIPSAELSELYRTPEQYSSLREQVDAMQAVVLPALETADEGEEGGQVARNTVQGGRAAAVEALTRGQVRGFHSGHYSKGHQATNLSHWVGAEAPYPVQFEEGYEPYVLAARRYVPWYDERFKGYRKNKVVHLLHMWRLGMQFVVEPRGFVVHAPHPIAPSWATTKSSGYWDTLKKMFGQACADMEAGTFVPVTGFRCRRSLPPMGREAE